MVAVVSMYLLYIVSIIVWNCVVGCVSLSPPWPQLGKKSTGIIASRGSSYHRGDTVDHDAATAVVASTMARD